MCVSDEMWEILMKLGVQGEKPAAVDRMDVSTSPPEASPTNSYPGANEGASLIPWLKGLSSGGGSGSGTASTTSSSMGLPPLHVRHGGSSSAPVTPPLSSPTARGGNPVKPDWDAIGGRDGGGGLPECATINHAFSSQQAAGGPWTHHPFLAAAAAAAHLRPGYCDTPDGARTPIEEVDSELSPNTALEFANVVCSSNSSKWANGVRVRSRSGASTPPLGVSSSSATGRMLGVMGLGPFPSAGGGQSDGGAFPSEPFSSHQTRRNPMQKSISVPVSPVSSKMRGFMNNRLARCPSELELSGAVQGLGSLWEREDCESREILGVKRKVPADDLELTLGNSTLRALSETYPRR